MLRYTHDIPTQSPRHVACLCFPGPCGGRHTPPKDTHLHVSFLSHTQLSALLFHPPASTIHASWGWTDSPALWFPFCVSAMTAPAFPAHAQRSEGTLPSLCILCPFPRPLVTTLVDAFFTPRTCSRISSSPSYTHSFLRGHPPCSSLPHSLACSLYLLTVTQTLIGTFKFMLPALLCVGVHICKKASNTADAGSLPLPPVQPTLTPMLP
jgi:hypothetical protein